MTIIRVGVDIAKSVFHVHGVDRQGKCFWSGKYCRAKGVDQIRKKVPQNTEIAMEACASAHYWARALMSHGFTVKLIAPQFVKPYVKSNKNDAVAIAEAMSCPHMRFVAVKSIDQQDIQALHRVRDFAASLGLNPRQHSMDGKDRLLGISKRGDSDLRKLLDHGAGSVIRHAQNKEDNLSHWINELKKRKHVNIATVALTNKTARISWAIITGDGHYDDKRVAA